MIEIDIKEVGAKAVVASQLKQKGIDNVILCIGTEKVMADSIGPRVGSLLNENMAKPLFVYGMQQANVTAENVSQMFNMIKSLHPNKKVLVVDAAVGEQSQIGKVQIANGAIVPGAATNKQLDQVGDISVIGIVSNKNMQDFYSNNCEKQLLAEALSQFIATSILMATK